MAALAVFVQPNIVNSVAQHWTRFTITDDKIKKYANRINK